MDAPPIEVIRSLLDYCPETGRITWKVKRNGVKAGSEAGTEHKGYRRIKICKKLLLSHRVAWAIHYGKWPEHEIDHINLNRADNRISNLREATRSQNMINRRYPRGQSKVTGVSKHNSGWQAHIRVNNRTVHLGLFGSIEAAAIARKAAEKIYGQFLPKEIK